MFEMMYRSSWLWTLELLQHIHWRIELENVGQNRSRASNFRSIFCQSEGCTRCSQVLVVILILWLYPKHSGQEWCTLLLGDVFLLQGEALALNLRPAKEKNYFLLFVMKRRYKSWNSCCIESTIVAMAEIEFAIDKWDYRGIFQISWNNEFLCLRNHLFVWQKQFDFYLLVHARKEGEVWNHETSASLLHFSRKKKNQTTVEISCVFPPDWLFRWLGFILFEFFPLLLTTLRSPSRSTSFRGKAGRQISENFLKTA